MNKRTHKLPLWALLLLALPLALAGCGNPSAKSETANPMSKTYYIFDTVVTVKVHDPGVTQANFDDIEGLLTTIDRKMNRQRKDSEIDQVNQHAGAGPIKVSPETFRVVKTALDFAAKSGGKFDPTVGPLVDLWGIGQEGAAVPDSASLASAMQLVDYKAVALDEGQSTIALARKGMSLDLGAIAKGYAADVIAQYLRDSGFHNAIIDLGGNILAMGNRPDGSNWRIGIQDPGEKRGDPLGMLEVKNKTLVTSGIYERFFKMNGNVYHHIFDSKTGYPTENNLLSVTIVTDVSMNADALSTSVFALGLDEGRRFIESRQDAEAIFVTKDNKVYVTSGLKSVFRLTHDKYQMG